MTRTDSRRSESLYLLAGYLAERSMTVATAAAGAAAHTDGRTVFVPQDHCFDDQRRAVLVQASLLAAGSLDPHLVRALRGRPALARRYLAVEAHRVLARLAPHLPLAAAVVPATQPAAACAEESLAVARSRVAIADPPAWFGTIKPPALLRSPAGTDDPDTDHRSTLRRREIHPGENDENDENDEDETTGRSSILELLQTPAFNSRALADLLRRLFGTGRSTGNSSAGEYFEVRDHRGARPRAARSAPVSAPSALHRSAPATGTADTLYPEWDVPHGRYRPQWCRVSVRPAPDPGSGVGIALSDEVLRRGLARIELSPAPLRRRPAGDDVDVDALVDFVADLRSGHPDPERVYTERRMVARALGVLILVDASGSTCDGTSTGTAVYDRQRHAAVVLGSTLADLGDRVAIYAFRSHGREAVNLLSIKTFDQGLGTSEHRRLAALQPSGYTRIGAAVRAAGTILKADAGTPRRLLVVLSDGFAYDHDYESRYAEADTRRSFEELRADGCASLCLSLAGDDATLHRVCGATVHAAADSLSELSPRMDSLFMAALRQV